MPATPEWRRPVFKDLAQFGGTSDPTTPKVCRTNRSPRPAESKGRPTPRRVSLDWIGRPLTTRGVAGPTVDICGPIRFAGLFNTTLMACAPTPLSVPDVGGVAEGAETNGNHGAHDAGNIAADPELGEAEVALPVNVDEGSETETCSAQECDDGDRCTVGTCDISGQCMRTPAVCTDENRCTHVQCSPSQGCLCVPIVCNDADPCTIDWCAPDDGLCRHHAADCDDRDVCTEDTCQTDSGHCAHQPACNDGDACTQDSCDAVDGTCRWVPALRDGTMHR